MSTFFGYATLFVFDPTRRAAGVLEMVDSENDHDQQSQQNNEGDDCDQQQQQIDGLQRYPQSQKPALLFKLCPDLKLFIALTLFCFITMPCEEVGWRGYALPALLDSISSSHFDASLMLGIMWTLWHVPLFFYSSPLYMKRVTIKQKPYFIAFCCYLFYLCAHSLLITYVWEQSTRDCQVAVTYHAFMLGSVMAFRPVRMERVFVSCGLSALVMWVAITCYNASIV